jgi:hypothetical protein
MKVSLRSCDEGQSVDGAADLAAENGVDAAVLLDAAEARELVRDHGGAEMVAAAREVNYVRPGAGDRRLDALLELLRRGHDSRLEGRYTS